MVRYNWFDPALSVRPVRILIREGAGRGREREIEEGRRKQKKVGRVGRDGRQGRGGQGTKEGRGIGQGRRLQIER